MDFIVTTNLECDTFKKLRINQADKFTYVRNDYIKEGRYENETYGKT